MAVRLIMGMIVVTLSFGLASCYESVNATHHSPGVYKGARDPLLEKERTAEQGEKLRERFRLVQVDR